MACSLNDHFNADSEDAAAAAAAEYDTVRMSVAVQKEQVSEEGRSEEGGRGFAATACV